MNVSNFRIFTFNNQDVNHEEFYSLPNLIRADPDLDMSRLFSVPEVSFMGLAQLINRRTLIQNLSGPSKNIKIKGHEQKQEYESRDIRELIIGA